jgi:hypothetical protein
MEYYSEDKRVRWDGLIVYKGNLDERHPQDFLRPREDDQSITHPRRPKDDVYVDGIQDPVFGLVDDEGNFVADESANFVQAPELPVSL